MIIQNKIKNIAFIWFFLVFGSTAFGAPVKVESSAGQLSVGPVSNIGSLESPNAEQPKMISPSKAEILVDNYTAASRKQGFAAALELMLIRNSHDSKIIEAPEVNEALAIPARYVKQYNYVGKELADHKQALFLEINFDSKAVSRLIRRSTEVMLIKSKPSLLVWLAEDMGKGKVLINDARYDGLIDLIKKKSQELKLPVLLPIGDLEEIKKVTPYDICHFDLDVINAASKRYGDPLVAVGCLKQSVLGSIWSSQWLLLQGDKTERFNSVGSSAEDVVAKGLTDISDKIIDITTSVKDDVVKIVLRVANVDGLEQYGQVVKYLKGFNKVIKQIDLLNINTNDIELSISAVGGEKALLNTLNMQSKLVPNRKVIDSPPRIDLDYKWKGSAK